jgi:hypothetical protein
LNIIHQFFYQFPLQANKRHQQASGEQDYDEALAHRLYASWVFSAARAL